MSITEFNKIFRREYGPQLRFDLKHDFCKVQAVWTSMADSYVKSGLLTDKQFSNMTFPYKRS